MKSVVDLKSPTQWDISLNFMMLIMGYKFESYDVDEVETMVTRTEHFMATDVEWDPTGR